MNFLYSNLRRTDLVSIKNRYPELDIAFEFLNELTSELRKKALQKNNSNTTIFIDYLTSDRLYVDIDQINTILPKIYYNFFFKVFISELTKKIFSKKIFIIEQYFDIFSKNLFFVLKTFYKRTDIKQYNYHLFTSAILNSSVSDFDNISDYNKYSTQVKTILKEINYITLIIEYKQYFSFSYETFFFTFNDEKSEEYCRYYKFFELENYLNNYGKSYANHDPFVRLNRSLPLIILCCFLNVKYFHDKNIYNDNLYIQTLINSQKKTPLLEEFNFKECLHFNNLLKIIAK